MAADPFFPLNAVPRSPRRSPSNSPHAHILRPRRSFQRASFSPKPPLLSDHYPLPAKDDTRLRSPLKLADAKANAAVPPAQSLPRSQGMAPAAQDSTRSRGRGRGGGGAMLFPATPDQPDDLPGLAPPSPNPPVPTASSAPPAASHDARGLKKLASSLSGAFSASSLAGAGRSLTRRASKQGFDLSDWNHDLAAIASHPSSSSSYPGSSPAQAPVRRSAARAAPSGDDDSSCPPHASISASSSSGASSRRPSDPALALASILELPSTETRRRKSDEMEDEARPTFFPAVPVRREYNHGRPHSLAHAHTLRSTRTLASSLLPTPASESPPAPPSKKISIEGLVGPPLDDSVSVFGGGTSLPPSTSGSSMASMTAATASGKKQPRAKSLTRPPGSGPLFGALIPPSSGGTRSRAASTASSLDTLPEQGGAVATFAGSPVPPPPSSASLSHLPPLSPLALGDGMTPPRRRGGISTTSGERGDLFASVPDFLPLRRHQAPSRSLDSLFLASQQRKRNSNGALLVPSASTNLSSPVPNVAMKTATPGWGVRDQDDDDDDDDDDDVMAWTGAGMILAEEEVPALTDGTTSASSSLSTSLSSHAEGDHVGTVGAGGGDFAHPSYKDVRPLQAAFMSSGLVSKRLSSCSSRPRDSGVSMGLASPFVASVQHPPPPSPQPSPAVVVAMGVEPPLPDTPVKKLAFTLTPSGTDEPSSSSSSSSPASSTSPLPAAHLQHHHTKASSPLAIATASTAATSSSRPAVWRRPPLFRRRSSGQLSSNSASSPSAAWRSGVPASVQSVQFRSGSSSSSSGMLLEDAGEPMTPTRSVGAGWSEATQLITTPCDSPLTTPATPAFPLPHLLSTMTSSSSAPLGLTTPLPSALNQASAFPFAPHSAEGAARPPTKHRHSGSALLTIRQKEMQAPSRFETNYTLLKPLGNGAFSDAVEVFDRPRGGVYAVKRTKHAFGGHKDRLRRLEEVDILRLVSADGDCSPHVISLIDAWEQGGHLFIQTELCAGGNLSTFLEEYGRTHEVLDEARVWKILAELSSGVKHLHNRNVIHLDLKPANVFVTGDGNLKLGDFGLATRWPRADALNIVRGAAVPSPTGSGWGSEPPVWPAMAEAGERRVRAKSNGDAPEDLEREGDREYIAPEILGGRYGKEADVFSLGLIILEAAANVVLPDNGPAWHKLRSNDFSDVDLSRLSSDLVHLLPGMLHKSPDGRLTIDGVALHPVVAQLLPPGAAKGALVEEDEGFLYRVFSAAYRNRDDDGATTAMEVDG